jgi:hypothetical protein
MGSRFVAAFGVVASLVVSAAIVRGEDLVAVLVTGPLTATAGERVSFEVEIVNRSGKPQQKLRIIDYFDKGFRHEASASPIEQKGTVDLAAGTSKRITLDFIAAEPGRQCHRVEILNPTGVFVGGATACVEVTQPLSGFQRTPPPTTPSPSASTFGSSSATPTVPLPSVVAPAVAVAPAASAATTPAVPVTPSLELGLKGPSEVDEGSVAEFVATVRNTGAVASSPGSLEFSWDTAFAPMEASDGYKLSSGKVAWNLPAIGPGEQLRRQVNLRAETASTSFGRLTGPANRPCVRSTLAGTGGGVIVADESCVLVRSRRPVARTARDAGLRVSLADCDDPVRVGAGTLLVCTVTNEGTSPIGGLDVSIVLPEQALVVGDPVPSRTRIDRSTVTFESLPSLAPGSRSTFQVAYRMPVAGSWRATATVSSPEIDGRVESSCSTSMIAP